jgi:hypothetical protein
VPSKRKRKVRHSTFISSFPCERTILIDVSLG